MAEIQDMISTTEETEITIETMNPTTTETEAEVMNPITNGEMMNMAEAITIEDMTTALEMEQDSMIAEEVTKEKKDGDVRSAGHGMHMTTWILVANVDGDVLVNLVEIIENVRGHHIGGMIIAHYLRK